LAAALVAHSTTAVGCTLTHLRPPQPPHTHQVASWWGPAWRNGTTDTQGVSTDAVVGLIVKELEWQPKRADGATMKLAFHLEPYPGGILRGGGGGV